MEDIEHPHRWLGACHEVGHLFLFKAAEVPVELLKLWGSGDNISGLCRPKGKISIPEERFKYYLAVSPAGMAAELIALEKYGFRIPEAWIERGSSSDVEIFHKEREKGDPSWTECMKVAKSVLIPNWSRLEVIATKLYRRGKHNGNT